MQEQNRATYDPDRAQCDASPKLTGSRRGAGSLGNGPTRKSVTQEMLAHLENIQKQTESMIGTLRQLLEPVLSGESPSRPLETDVKEERGADCDLAATLRVIRTDARANLIALEVLAGRIRL